MVDADAGKTVDADAGETVDADAGETVDADEFNVYESLTSDDDEDEVLSLTVCFKYSDAEGEILVGQGVVLGGTIFVFNI